MRAPLAPMGWPSAIAPPLTLTFDQSKPSSRPSASDLRRERLVDLDQVERLDRHLDLGEQLLDALDRGEEEPLRRDLRLGVADDPGERLQAEPLHGALAGDDRRRGAVGDARRVAGRDRAVGHARRRIGLRSGSAKTGFSRPSASRLVSRARPFVGVDSRPSSLPLRTGTGTISSSKRPASIAAMRLLVALQRELVLVLAADLGLGSRRARRACPCGRTRSRTTGRRGRSRRPARRCRGGSRSAPWGSGTGPGSCSPCRPRPRSRRRRRGSRPRPSMIAFRPEPQTRLIVVALVESARPRLEGRLARRRLADAGLEHLAHEHLVDLVGRARRRARPRRGWRCRPASLPARRRASRRTCRSACARRRRENLSVRAIQRAISTTHKGHVTTGRPQ